MIKVSHEAFARLNVAFSKKLMQGIAELEALTSGPEHIERILAWCGEVIFRGGIFDDTSFNLVEKVYSGYYQNNQELGTSAEDPNFKAVLDVLPTAKHCEDVLSLRTKYVHCLLEGTGPIIKAAKVSLAPKIIQEVESFCDFLRQALMHVAAMESQETSQVAWASCWAKITRVAAELKACQGKRRTEGQ